MRAWILAVCVVVAGCSSSPTPEESASDASTADETAVATIDAPIDDSAPESTPADTSASPLDSTTADSATDSSLDTALSTDAPVDTATDAVSDSAADAPDSSAVLGACASAIDITSAIADGGVYEGTTSGTFRMATTCSDQLAPKAILKVVMPYSGNNRFDIVSKKPAADPSAASAAVIVRRECAAFTSEMMCNPDADTKSTFVGVPAAGPIYLIVDGDFFASGFTVKRSGFGAACFTDASCADYPGAKCNASTGICVRPFACPTGTADCNKNPDDGCETNIAGSDSANCGGCGSTCSATVKNTTDAKCVAGKCVLTCTAGHGDCDDYRWSGCEANLDEDGTACGACGKSCSGGSCKSSVCGPAAEIVTTLGKASGHLQHLGIDDANVYVLDRTTDDLWKAPKGLATTAVVLDNTYVLDFAASASGVWWAAYGAQHVIKKHVAGVSSTVTTLAKNLAVEKMAFVGGDLWLLLDAVPTDPIWTPPTLQMLAPGATTPTNVWTAPKGYNGWLEPATGGGKLVIRASDGTYASSLFSIDSPTATPTAFGDTPGFANVFATDGVNAWFPSSTGGVGTLRRVALGATTSSEVWSGAHVNEIAVDGTNVYFSACNGLGAKNGTRIYRMPKGGGAATELAYDGVGTATGTALYPCAAGTRRGRWLAVDATHLYWVSGASVKRMPK